MQFVPSLLRTSTTTKEKITLDLVRRDDTTVVTNKMFRHCRQEWKETGFMDDNLRNWNSVFVGFECCFL